MITLLGWLMMRGLFEYIKIMTQQDTMWAASQNAHVISTQNLCLRQVTLTDYWNLPLFWTGDWKYILIETDKREKKQFSYIFQTSYVTFSW